MPPTEERDPRSIAEDLFASVLLEGQEAARERLEALCSERPELAGALRELQREWRSFRSVERVGLPTPLTDRTDDAPSPRIGDYLCKRRIGHGGMGEIWEAEDGKLGRRVALKLLPAGFLASSHARERFRREALAASRVHHPGIVTVFAAGTDEQRPWIAQELVEGGRSLGDVVESLRRRGEVPSDHERAMAELFARIAEALAEAHAAGVVHRDLKPQNILLTPDGLPKVTDFGLARLEGQSPLSSPGQFLGTWLYASPEHVLPAPRGADERSDVFSLGVTLYECLTLRRPFEGETTQEISRAILLEDPPLPDRVRQRVPRDLAVICSKALGKRPEDRYATMSALAADLRRFLADEPIRARPPGWVERARRSTRRHPVRVTSLVLGTVAAIGLAILFWRTQTALDRARVARAGEERANEELRSANEELRRSRDEARSEREVSDEVVNVLTDLFDAADPAYFGQEEPTVRTLVERASEKVRAGQPASPSARIRLLGTLGGALLALGDWAESERLLAEALRIGADLGRDPNADPAVLAARVALCNARLNQSGSAAALELARPLVDLWRAGRLPSELAAAVLADAGVALRQEGAYDEARASFEESLALRVEQFGLGSFKAAYGRSLLAQIDYRQGRFADGLARIEKDVEPLAPLLAAGNTIALDVVNMRGLFLQALGRLPEAEVALREAHRVARAALGPDHARTLVLEINVGTVLEDLGRLGEAELVYRRVVELSMDRFGPDVSETRTAKNNLGQCLLRQARSEEAELLLREVLVETERACGPDHLETAQARLSLAYCLYGSGDAAEAADLTERALPAIPRGSPLRPRVEEALALFRAAVGERAVDPADPR